MKQFLKITCNLLLAGLLLTGGLAALLLLSATWIPDLQPSIILMGDHPIHWPEAGSTASIWLIAWLALWLTLVLSTLVIVFTLALTGSSLILAGLLLFLPLALPIALLIWILGRKSKHSRHPPADSPPPILSSTVNPTSSTVNP